MNKHKEFCEELGNTRLKYTEEDRKMREVLEKAMKVRETEEYNGMRPVQLHEYRQNLKKLNKFRKDNFGKFTGDSER